MKVYENDCVSCDLPCIDCGRRRSPHWYCDQCEEEYQPDRLYDYDGEDLCKDCLATRFQTVEERDRQNMAYTIHGTVEVDFHKNGHWQDLADILLLNGYTLEITKKENKEKIEMTIMRRIK